jgi:hypothetical protein
MSASACTWRRVNSCRHAGQHLPVGRRGTGRDAGGGGQPGQHPAGHRLPRRLSAGSETTLYRPPTVCTAFGLGQPLLPGARLDRLGGHIALPELVSRLPSLAAGGRA